MKKVGIVSLYNGENFGNKLQNYALEQVLQDIGYSAETFRYDLSAPQVQTKPSRKLSPAYILSYFHSRLLSAQLRGEEQSLPRRLLYLRKHGAQIAAMKQQRKETFAAFDKEALHFAEHHIAFNESNEWTKAYEAFVCGSDQVWNPYYNSTSEITFLQFALEEKRIAYAPSFGVSELPDDRQTEYAAWLRGIPHLSVREESGAKLIAGFGLTAPVMPDPTILLTAEQWAAFGAPPKNAPAPQSYILCYFLGRRTKRYCRFIQSRAKRDGLKIISLFDAMQPEYQGIGPREFVHLFQNAALICTDSFHASVFSILFHKPFAVFERVEGKRRMSSRITTLLQTYSLESQKFTTPRVWKAAPDFAAVDETLDAERKRAFAFLHEALTPEKINEKTK